MQESIFDLLYPKFKIDRKVRLISLFSGYDSQALALKYLGVDFEHYKTCEWAIKSTQALKDLHFSYDNNDYSKTFSIEEVKNWLYEKGISSNWNNPMTKKQVERILDELEEKPQILLMENVPQVHSQENIKDFQKWQLKLESLGYKNYTKDLIATDYGIPQIRNRCFMLSILGDYSYNFPEPVPLEKKLKDLLEDQVDEKYYLSDEMIKYISADNDKWSGNNDKSIINKTLASTLNTREGQRRCDASNYVSNDVGGEYNLKERIPNLKIKNNNSKGYLKADMGDGVDISGRMQYHRGTVQKQKAQTLTRAGG